MRLIIFTYSLLLCSVIVAQTKFLHVDQFGYRLDAEKILVINNPMEGFNAMESYTPSDELELVSIATNQVVYTASPAAWNNGQIHAQSGDQGWWIDFSDFQTEGEYLWRDPVSGDFSHPFTIDVNPYEDVLNAAVRMFYYNRCNHEKAIAEANQWNDGNNFLNPLQDGECSFVLDSENEALRKDLSGGWFDAGDYNKYVTFATTAVHDLLTAYETYPDAFSDNTNIPESGNGLPDVLDEVKWELDWLMKMIDDQSGLTHIKMGSIDYDENSLSPPSLNTDRRYYGPTCTASTVANAFMLSRGAAVFGNVDGQEQYADELLQAALTSWNALLPLLETNQLDEACDDGTILSGDADWTADLQKEYAVTAAMQLWMLTQDPDLHTYVIENFDEYEFIDDQFWGSEYLTHKDVCLNYAAHPNANSMISAEILQSFQNDVSNNWNGLFDTIEDDLYLAFMPDWSYHWGSNLPKAWTGVLNQMIDQHGIVSGDTQSYLDRAERHVHYFHGVNPLGLVYLSNMYGLGADHCVNEIYHTWFWDGTEYDHAINSELGPPPGYLSGGPNQYFSVETLSPPANQPMQKAYLDFNDNWPNNSWEISEPAIYYQAGYVRLLAAFVSGSDTPDNVKETQIEGLSWFPNPGSDMLRTSHRGKLEVRVYNTMGTLVLQQMLNTGASIDCSHLPGGVYVIHASDGDHVFKNQWIKQ